jgi:hypothetical protein
MQRRAKENLDEVEKPSAATDQEIERWSKGLDHRRGDDVGIPDSNGQAYRSGW